eukprot:TRINITY_DN17622_c0_g1_i1.p1 TRINITY_DN17622_c0_g1~~TRINITY_DN17622_c0_g1_i1.p1  ORF type:complete len:1068 (+),score=188.35 TRINITY_DN17622_c0_g1_i1:398-3205(+)
MEELFSNQAHLFFVRLSSWFAVTLPMLYELGLQLRVFLTFLEFKEQSFVRAFFESGVVVSILNALSSELDVPDEVRCLAIVVLHRLSVRGRVHKEVLCSRGLISNLKECVIDGLKWETLKCAGWLLCELFRSNPLYQKDVLGALHELLELQLPSLQQRVGIKVIVELLTAERGQLPALVCDPKWHQKLVPQAIALLESQKDLRLSADAYCMLCRLLRSFSCDSLLFDFARKQVHVPDDANEWLHLEVEAFKHTNNAPAEEQRSRLNRLAASHLPREAADLASSALAKAASGSVSPASLRKAGREGTFGQGFRTEAVHVLKLELVVLLAKRNPDLCDELVDSGLTEMLLLCMLDVAHPMRQSSAITELHHIRLLSPKAQGITEQVLVKKNFIRAVSIEQFMAAGTFEDLARSRLILRNLQIERLGKPHHSAAEHELQHRLAERKFAETLVASGTGTAFLTEGPDEDADGAKAPDSAEEAAEQEKTLSDEAIDIDVPRSGEGVFAVRRVPVHTSSEEKSLPSERAAARGYRLDRMGMDKNPVDEPPVLTALFSLLDDPLDHTADSVSPLFEDLRSIQANVGFSECRGPLVASVPSRQLSPIKKPSHKPTVEHMRAVALRPVAFGKEPGVKPWPRSSGRPESPEDSRAPSESSSSVSLLCVPLAEDKSQLQLHGASCSCQECRWPKSTRQLAAKHGLNFSLADTSIGPEISMDLSNDDPSHEFTSVSQHDPLGLEHSLMTAGSSSLGALGGASMFLDEGEDPQPSTELGKVRPKILQKSALATLVQVPKLPIGKNQVEIPDSKSLQKKVLCVAPAPYHRCVAFHGESFVNHADPLKQEQTLLNPNTQQLFKELRSVGPFPRRLLKGTGQTRPSQLGEGHTPSDAPWTAREIRQMQRDDSSDVGAQGVFHGVEGFEEMRKPQARNLKDYFPASARARGI